MQRLKGKKIGVIIEAGIPMSLEVRRGMAGILTEAPAIRVRLVFPPGESEEARRTLKMLQWFLPRESEHENELQEMNRHLLHYPALPDLIFLVIYSSEIVPFIKESLQHYTGVPVLIALAPGSQDLTPAEVLSIFHYPHLFWVPFGWFPVGSTDTPTLLTRTDLWGEACYRAYQEEQLSPCYLEYMGHQ